jgi:hypothetical protein
VKAGNNDVMRTKSYILLEIGDILHAVYTIPWNYETHDSDLKFKGLLERWGGYTDDLIPFILHFDRVPVKVQAS